MAAGLNGIAGEWAFGYPAFLLRRRDGEWRHVPLTFPEDSYVNSIVSVLPRSASERWLLTDAGSVWRHDDAGALQRLDVPDTENPVGNIVPWSFAVRGDEVWLANGCERQ